MKQLFVFFFLILLNLTGSLLHKKKFFNQIIPEEIKVKNTPKQDWGNAKTWNLDRHQLECEKGTGLSYFHLYRPDKTSLSYSYECNKNSAISSDEKEVKVLKTPLNDSSGDYFTNYLDRHFVKCPKGHILSYLKLSTDGANRSKIQYIYKCVPAKILCCHSKTTGKTDAGTRSETVFLDRQRVGLKANKAHVLAGFKLHTSYHPNRYWYTFIVCKLEDVELEKKLNNTKKSFEEAKKEANNLKIKVVQTSSQKNNNKQIVLTSKKNLKFLIHSLEEAKSLVSKKEEEVKKAKQLLDEARKAHKTATYSLETSQKKILTYNKDLDKANKKLDHERKKLNNIQSLIAKFENDIKLAKEKKTRNEQELTDLKKKHKLILEGLAEAKSHKLAEKDIKDATLQLILKAQSDLIESKQKEEEVRKKKIDLYDNLKKSHDEYIKAKNQSGLKMTEQAKDLNLELVKTELLPSKSPKSILIKP